MKAISALALGLSLLFIGYSVVCYAWFAQEIGRRDARLQTLEEENKILKSEVEDLKPKLERAAALLQNITNSREGMLRNPTWEELKTFLLLDKTNELTYSKEKFDCTAFALQLLKNARHSGFRTGFVEIEYAEQPIGHMLNAFETEKGFVFIDVTGNENGTGKDKVAYVEVGKPYGVIELERVKERIPDCSIACEELAVELPYTTYSAVFSYEYFLKVKACKDLYEECVRKYNEAADDFNRRSGRYSYQELSRWYNNLMLLKEEIISGNFYIVSEANTVKNVNIYW